LKRHSLTAEARDLGDSRLRFSVVRVVSQDHVDTGAREVDSRVSAETATAAGNQCNSGLSIAHGILRLEQRIWG
jgi:hypothetical protein